MTDRLARATDRPLDAADLDSATEHYAKRREAEDTRLESLVVFRLGGEWLGLPTSLLDRVADVPAVHTLPHRRSGATAGLVNVGGDLVVHVSLAGLLGIAAAPASDVAGDARRRVVQRLLVLTDVRGKLATTVDEVLGIHHHDDTLLRPVPPTLARAASSYTRAMLIVDGHMVGCLDGVRVMRALSAGLS